MPQFYIELDGAEDGAAAIDSPSLDAARDEAIVMLGNRLQTDPAFAYQRHWRVDVRDESRRLRLHVIVATVEAPPPINWQSYD